MSASRTKNLDSRDELGLVKSGHDSIVSKSWEKAGVEVEEMELGRESSIE